MLSSQRDTDDTCQFTIEGEVDVATAQKWRDVGTAALQRCTGDQLVVDVSAVSFIDSTGLGMLVSLRNSAEERGLTVALRGTPPRMQRLLELTGMEGLFPLVP